MLGIPIEQLIPIANFLGLAALGALAAVGLKWGQKQSTPAEKTMEIAGALVDSESVRLLAAAIEAHTMESMEGRHQMRTAVDCLGKHARAVEALAGEVEEMRRAVGDVANQIARMK